MASVTFDHVYKRFGDVIAVNDLNIHIEDKEFLVLVGPSGCGKTTALRCLAGLEDISEGRILIGDHVVNDVAPKDRDIAMVFQSYALYPHMSVFDNMAFGLKLRKTPRDEIERRVNQAAKILGIEQLLDRKPRQLSGGQRQRVAVGRAIVREPKVFLFDEPLSNLDAKLRVETRANISKLHQQLQTTFIYVTHDQTEAMTMGDRVAVLRKISREGESNLQQIDSPRNLYDSPDNLFVAGFIGSPSMNFVYGTIQEEGGEIHVKFAGHSLRVDRAAIAKRPSLGNYSGQEIVLGLRPEAFEIAQAMPNASDDQKITVKPQLVEQLGSEAYVHFEMDSPPVITPDIQELLEDQGADEESLGSVTKFTARVNPDLAPDTGQETVLVVDTSKLHYFDKDTGTAIR